MVTTKVLSLAVLLMLLLGFTAGCSDVAEPQAVEAASTTSSSSSTVEGELELLAESGIGIEGSRGIFAVKWRRMYDPQSGEFRIAGHADAIGFAEETQQMPPYESAGVDMGSVTLGYQAGEVVLNKLERGKGIVYTSESPPDAEERTEVAFVAGGGYGFDVSGSDDFGAIALTVTAPPALITVTSHADHAEIDGGADLTVAWSGGGEAGRVLIRVAPHRPPPPGDQPGESDGPPPGPDGPPPGPGGRPGGPPDGSEGPPGGQDGPPPDGRRPPPPPPGCIVEILEGNPGEYTIPAAKLGKLTGAARTGEIVLIISQLISNEIEYDGGVLHGIVECSDHVVLVVQ